MTTFNLEKEIECIVINAKELCEEKEDFFKDSLYDFAKRIREVERERKREKILEAKEHRRKQGKFLGGTPPFGYIVNQRRILEKDPLQQNAIVFMKCLRKKGMAYRAISKAIESRMKIKISYAGVMRILAEKRKIR